MIIKRNLKPIMIWAVIVILITSGIIPTNQVSAETEGDYEYTDNGDGTARLDSYSGNDSDLVIPNTLGGLKVTSIKDEAFMEWGLTSVTIPETVTTIGDLAFFQNQLTTITIPDGVTSLGSGAFGLNQLTSVNLGKGLTVIDDSVFALNELSEIVIPDRITGIGIYAFATNPLEKVVIENRWMNIGMRAFDQSQPDLTIVGHDPSTAKDYANANGHKFIDGGGTATFSQNGNSHWKQSDSTEVNVSGYDETKPLQYAWSTSSSTPTKDWSPLSNGDLLTAPTESGEYYLHVSGTNFFGGKFNVSSEAFLLDNMKPTAPKITAPITWQNSDVLVEIEDGDDGHSGVEKTEYRIDNGSWETFSIPISVAASGETTIEARTVDNAGNLSDVTTFTVKIDKELPEISLQPNGGDFAKSHSTTVTATDSGGSGIAKIEYQWTKEESFPTSGIFQDATSDGSLIAPAETGNYYLHSKATDHAGNVTKFSSDVFKLDNTKPTAPKITAPITWQNGDVLVEVEHGDDDHSGVQETEYRIDDGSWETFSIPISVVASGETTIEARTADNAGNLSDVTTFTVKIDKELPEISLQPNGGDFSKSHSTTVTATDSGGSGIAKIEYQWTKEESFSTSGIFQDATSDGSLIAPAETGNYYLHSKATDHAGNVTKFSSDVFKIDNTAPSKPIIELPEESGADGWYIDPPVELNIHPGEDNEGGSGIAETKYRMDGGAWQTVEKRNVIVTKEGITEVETITIDKLGNESEIARVNIHLDSAIPKPPTIQLSDDNWTRDDVVVTIQKDGETLSGHDYIEWTKDSSSDNWEKYDNPIEITDSGETVIFARSVNKAGNKSDETKADIQIDQIGPTIDFSKNGDTTRQQKASTMVTVEDKLSGIDPNGLYYIWTDEDKAPGYDSNWELFTDEEELTLSRKTGAWYLHIYAKDQVGNESIQSTAAFQLYIPSSGGGGGATPPTPSNDATLERLEINFGEDSLINFDPNQTEYSTETEADKIELVAEPSHSGVTMTVNGDVVEGEVTLPLEEGENVFAIVITAEDGTTEEYTLTINRLKKVPFPDVEGHWAKDYIKTAYRNGWFKGYSDGSFGPENRLTRMQSASLFVRILGFTESSAVPFSDIQSISDKTMEELKKAYANGVINGYSDQTFKPYADVTRAQLALMIYRTYEKVASAPYEPKQTADFPDIAGYDKETQKAIAMLVELGIAEGSEGDFMPNNRATRAHAAKMLVNFKEALDNM